MLDRVGAHVVRRAVWVILASVAAVIGLNVMVPQLETVVARDSTAFVPHDAESEIAFREMSRDFGTGPTAQGSWKVASVNSTTGSPGRSPVQTGSAQGRANSLPGSGNSSAVPRNSPGAVTRWLPAPGTWRLLSPS